MRDLAVLFCFVLFCFFFNGAGKAMLDAWGQPRSQDFFPFLKLGKVLGTRLGRVATVKKLKADVLSHYSPSSQLSISFRWQ